MDTLDNIASLITAIASLTTALVSIFLFCVARRQLISFQHNNISRDINQAKKNLNHIALNIARKSLDTSYDEYHIIILEEQKKSAVEDYLNSLDTLARQILKKGLPEKELKDDYQRVIIEAVQLWEENFTITTPYKNLQKLYEKWKI